MNARERAQLAELLAARRRLQADAAFQAYANELSGTAQSPREPLPSRTQRAIHAVYSAALVAAVAAMFALTILGWIGGGA